MVRTTLPHLLREVSLRSAIAQILQGNVPEETELNRILSQVHWSRTDRYFCVVARARNASMQPDSAALMALAIQTANVGSGDFFQLEKESIVFLFNLSMRQASRRHILSLMDPALQKHSFLAGGSLEFSDLGDLPRGHRQCLAVLDVASQKWPETSSLLMEDCSLAYAVRRLAEDPLKEAMIPAGLQNILAYDRIHETDYARCLRVFLDNNMNIARSTAVLYLHRNTFLYRRGRIQKLLEMDPENPQV